MLNERKDYTSLFIISVYALFWTCIILTGGMAVLFGDKAPMQLLVTICSWTPTMVLLIMFKKLLPDRSRGDFFKSLFEEKINWSMFLALTVIQLSLVLASIYIVAVQKELPTSSLLNLSLDTLSYIFFVSLITGATGEEAAWRGYLFPVMVKKSGLIKGNILLGLIWGFWHAPLWLATSGFAGLDLLIYIVSSIFLITSVSLIIGICYNYNKNLIIPIWIHLLLNFSGSLYAGKVENLLLFYSYLTLFYVLTAFGFILWHKNFIRVG